MSFPSNSTTTPGRADHVPRRLCPASRHRPEGPRTIFRVMRTRKQNAHNILLYEYEIRIIRIHMCLFRAESDRRRPPDSMSDRRHAFDEPAEFPFRRRNLEDVGETACDQAASSTYERHRPSSSATTPYAGLRRVLALRGASHPTRAGMTVGFVASCGTSPKTEVIRSRNQGTSVMGPTHRTGGREPGTSR